MTRLYTRAARLVAASAFLMATLATPAMAQQVALSIAPLGATLSANPDGKPVQEVFNLTNSGDGEATFEVQVLAWAQDDVGAPVYTPSDDFLVFPKTLTINPGKTRAVRLMARSGGTPELKAQRFYRIQFREIPRSFSVGDTDEMRISLVTRILVPLVLQHADFKEEAALEAKQTPQGLRIANPGAALLKVSSIYCGDTRVSGLLYVHPGASALLPQTTCAQSLRVAREGREDTVHEVSAQD